MVVNTRLPVKSIQDYIALARKEPGKLTYASWGVGSSSQVAMEMLNVGQGLNVLHVPFTGAAPAMPALLAGQVDARFVHLSPAQPSPAAGQVRLLWLGAPTRSSRRPQV